MSNPSQPFYVAFDQITLIEPIYGDTFSLDKIKHNLLFLENDEISSSIYPDSITQTDYLLNITDRNSIISTTTQNGLTTILGLSIGKGIPAALGVIGFIIYIIKKIENRTKRAVRPIKDVDNHRSKK
ncbi:unnamed protein product [Rotaria sordida]|uniref:Uncharacterized protein n=1 Tax=Rotaria sordida TaxID=392033 RepID=A0A814RT08_9BILA|nr:unnamed protein product [Rotaria sordida]